MASYKSEMDVMNYTKEKIGTKNKYNHVPGEYKLFYSFVL